MQNIDSATPQSVPFTLTSVRKAKNLKQGYMLLDTNRSALVSVYKSVRSQVEDVIEAMVPGQPYTLREICGEKYWAGLNKKSIQRMAGACMADMVRKGMLRLKFAGKKGSTWQYEIDVTAL